MQIFVSWSGVPARELADFLQTWLRQVIQELEPFMSKNSIEKGARWSPEISTRLGETNQAIVCVTNENQKAEWLNFEAGALAKATDSRVRTLLIDVTPSDVTGPLSEFQHTIATNKEDVRQLISSVNEHCKRSLPQSLLDSVFEREWPAFDAKVEEVIELGRRSGATGKRKRSDSDLLAEILDRVRTMERSGQEQSFMTRAVLEQLVGPVSGNAFELLERQPDSKDLHAATRLIGTDITVKLPNGKFAHGEVQDVVQRGKGVFVRVQLPDGSREALPLSSVSGVPTPSDPSQ